MKGTIHPVLLALGAIGILLIGAAVGWALLKGQPTVKIGSFAECAAAGNPVMESYPRQCRANGVTFVEEIPSDTDDVGGSVDVDVGTCKNTCGDGTCAEIVCLAVGCPCAETPQSCPADCR